MRYVEDHATGASAWNHGHHHHHHKKSYKKLDDVKNDVDNVQPKSSDGNENSFEMLSHDSLNGKNSSPPSSLLRKVNSSNSEFVGSYTRGHSLIQTRLAGFAIYIGPVSLVNCDK